MTMDGTEETVLIVDGQNRIVGAKPRPVMRRQNLPHRATYILVFDRDQRLFVHKRSHNKDVFPGYYDIAAGGVVIEGETYRQSAERELFEELGIRDVPLNYLFEFNYKDACCNVWGSVYQCEYNGEMKLQAEEIESGRFMKIEEILMDRESMPITPDSFFVLKRYLRVRNMPAAS